MSMRLRILHQTRYTYSEPARGVLQLLRLTPRDHDGQHVVRWRIEPSEAVRLTAGTDHFGNAVHTLAADEPLDELTLRVEGEAVTTDTAGVVRGAVERVPEASFLRETDLTTADDAIRGFADGLRSEPEDALATLHRLLLAVGETMRFDTAPTTSVTRASEAFALRRGVCQDLTHIFLAAARHMGIPARYVSGYFHRADGVVEQEAGHAWAEAVVPGLGWVGFDPTNGICATDAHLRVAVGLDYLGAAPVRGSRRGGGQETLTVRIRVERPAGGGRSQSQSQSQYSEPSPVRPPA